MIIYMATNRVNGKEYIGQTVGGLEKRKQEHIWIALAKKHDMYFHKALCKHGFENFDWETLHECNNINDLNKLELYYIDLHNTFKKGYNLTLGGNNIMFGRKHTDVTRSKMSESHKGKKLSDTTKRKQSETAKRMPDATKRKLSVAATGKNNPFYGKKHSKKTLRKMSVTQRKRNRTNQNAVSVKIDGRYFCTITDAARFLNVGRTTVKYRLERKVKGYEYINV